MLIKFVAPHPEKHGLQGIGGVVRIGLKAVFPGILQSRRLLAPVTIFMDDVKTYTALQEEMIEPLPAARENIIISNKLIKSVAMRKNLT